jgi:hypothetical protein
MSNDSKVTPIGIQFRILACPCFRGLPWEYIGSEQGLNIDNVGP